MRERRENSFEALILTVLIIVVVIVGGAWAWVMLAGGVFGAGWPHLSLAVLAHAFSRMPHELSDPRLAFPRRMRGRLPLADGFYAALVLMLAAVVMIATVAVRAVARARAVAFRPGGRRGARWAWAWDLRTLRQHWWSRGRRDARLGLGYRNGQLLRGEAKHALVVFGPPQSGKSAGLAIPALLEWEGPVIASSIKTDLLDATIAARRERGDVLVFDPLELLEAPSSTWSPLATTDSWTGALSTAMRLAGAGQMDSSNVKGGDFWSAAAEQRLAPLLFAAGRTGRGIRDVVRWAYGLGDAELPRILEDLVDEASSPDDRLDCEAAFDAHQGFASMAGETRGSVESTVQLLLRAYRSPIVQRSASSSEISAERLLSGSTTLYLIGDPHRSKLLRPLFLALLQEMIDAAYEHANRCPGKRLELPLLICLDELGNTAPLPALGEIATSAPSHNIQLVSIFHDVAQARTRYGDQAQTVINSHRARMLLPGVADLETLRYFSSIIGEEEIIDRHGDGVRGENHRRRPLAAPELLRQIADRRAVLVYGRIAPTRLRLRMYFKDRRLRRLATPRGTP